MHTMTWNARDCKVLQRSRTPTRALWASVDTYVHVRVERSGEHAPLAFQSTIPVSALYPKLSSPQCTAVNVCTRVPLSYMYTKSHK